jgi:hypothetical protein
MMWLASRYTTKTLRPLAELDALACCLPRAEFKNSALSNKSKAVMS